MIKKRMKPPNKLVIFFIENECSKKSFPFKARNSWLSFIAHLTAEWPMATHTDEENHRFFIFFLKLFGCRWLTVFWCPIQTSVLNLWRSESDRLEMDDQNSISCAFPPIAGRVLIKIYETNSRSSTRPFAWLAAAFSAFLLKKNLVTVAVKTRKETKHFF